MLSGTAVAGVLSVPVTSWMVSGTVVSGGEETDSARPCPQAATNINAPRKEKNVLKRYMTIAVVVELMAMIDLPAGIAAGTGCHQGCLGLSNVAVAWATASGPGRA